MYKNVFLTAAGPSAAAEYRLRNSNPQDRVYNIYISPE